MDSFTWSADFDLGIDIIDNQHRQIGSYIVELEHAISANDESVVLNVVEKLKDYTLDHFAFEEQLLERTNYVLQDAHKQVHRRFEGKVAVFEEQLKEGKNPMLVARKMHTTLMIWLIQHIKNEDADYVPVVKPVLQKETSWIGSALKRIFSKAMA